MRAQLTLHLPYSSELHDTSSLIARKLTLLFRLNISLSYIWVVEAQMVHNINTRMSMSSVYAKMEYSSI